MSMVAGPAPVILTSDIDEFIAELRDGDVLLFHSLHPFSHAIRLIDNSPVNHCALYKRDGEQMVHAGLPIIKQDASGKAVRVSVREDPLRARLRTHVDRDVTALRLPQKDIASDALREAEDWVRIRTRYGFKDLLSLAATCVQRSYGSMLGKAEKLALCTTAHALSFVSAATAGPPELSVTCSAFVYSCYMFADPSSIEIGDPLSIWTGKKPERRYRGLETGSPDDPELGIAFRDAGDSDSDEWIAAPRSATAADDFDAVLANERFELHREMLRDRDQTLRRRGLLHRERGKVVPLASQEPAPYAQTITPFDLWQSPSLTAVCALHLPPRPDDRVLERRGQSVD